ncbi:hypothetical protein [Sphingomonas xanthus]|uniref:Uncharacterized protein n=1 Tax=Sphingomonas xanthus TaxID=2594473 RepID=A0A516IR17_9SPHN|nr:hypothetical protein [Sphingomonas xanthus]QDP19341.1 hypothetical protein FMM02_04790 [Sphingomonas xanthus]
MSLRAALVLLLLAAGSPAELPFGGAAAHAASPKAKPCLKKHDHKADSAARKSSPAARKTAEKRSVVVIDRSVRQIEILSFGP